MEYVINDRLSADIAIDHAQTGDSAIVQIGVPEVDATTIIAELTSRGVMVRTKE